jgi:enamine deaminase RidA (YjgF/YER057c/UK114 family)
MRLSRLGAGQRAGAAGRLSGGEVPEPAQSARVAFFGRPGSQAFSTVDVGDCARVSLMLNPQGRGAFAQQAEELLSMMRHVLEELGGPVTVIAQTVFLREASDRAECERIFSRHYRATAPVSNFVLQPPCCGALVALEALAIRGASANIERFGPHALAVSFADVRWVYCAGVESANLNRGAYPQTIEVLKRLGTVLGKAVTGFEHVVRTWFYLGSITQPEGEIQRYKELNRARTDLYQNVSFCRSLSEPMIPQGIYPASTGIGTAGMGLVASCLSVQTTRKDAFLVALENPQQTPSYAYPRRHSPKSPKFSRVMALVLGEHAITWVSGTASIVNSESRHYGDIGKQTEQAIENIARLISRENFTFHGVSGVGATLRQLAKIRVYIKRQEDFAACKTICESHCGEVPAIYAIADICRPELLVEIEGLAYSNHANRAQQLCDDTVLRSELQSPA